MLVRVNGALCRCARHPRPRASQISGYARHVAQDPKSRKYDFSWEIRDCGFLATWFLQDFSMFPEKS